MNQLHLMLHLHILNYTCSMRAVRIKPTVEKSHLLIAMPVSIESAYFCLVQQKVRLWLVVQYNTSYS